MLFKDCKEMWYLRRQDDRAEELERVVMIERAWWIVIQPHKLVIDLYMCHKFDLFIFSCIDVRKG